MRLFLVVVLLGLAFWRAWLDWRATIAQGYAFRLSSIERTFAENWPGAYERTVQAWQGLGVPWLWDPVGTTFLALPLTMVLGVLAALIWVTRHRGRGRG